MTFKQSDKIKYFGVILDKNLNFEYHLKKIKQNLYPVISNFERKRKFLSEKLAEILVCRFDKTKFGILRSFAVFIPMIISRKIENRCLKTINFTCSKVDTRQIHKIHPTTKRYNSLHMLSIFKLNVNLAPIIDQSLMPDTKN